MLISLHVKNLALVENITIAFAPGLNVITGETGAGKSILIGALSLLLGERADKSLIRSGETSCSASALFHLETVPRIDALLEAHGLERDEDGQLLIRRMVRQSGAGQILVNDHPVTLQFLKKLGNLLVDIHGPYDHQSLLRAETQLDILDAFAGLERDRAAYVKTWEAHAALVQRKAELEGSDESLAEQLDILRFRIQEIEQAELREGEEDEVINEYNVVANAGQILEQTGAVCGALYDNEGSAFEWLADAQRRLDGLVDLLPESRDWLKELEGVAAQVQELHRVMRDRLDRMEADPGRLDWLEQRRMTYEDLKKKFNGSVADILEKLSGFKQRLHDLETRDQQLESLEADLEKAAQQMVKSGKGLRKKRQAAAVELAKDITAHLQPLGFPHGAFSVSLKEADPHRSGMDEVEFEFAPNAGEAMRPLRAIASSGEIARVMLATKAVLAKHDQVPVLIFDEIDANVGGEMGSAIGQKLKDVAAHHQVISITHLPQVAIYGSHHFAVEKSARGGRTVTGVQELYEEKRVEEIARMLGGKDLTKVTLQHARELLDVSGARA